MRTKAVFDNIAEHLEEQIDLAENKIVVAVAWFTNKRLFDALCKKAADGVKVKLIISDNEINRNSNIDYGDIQIGKSKLYLIDEEKMHNKFCIIDDYIVITGSYNWSYRAESNFENILICSGDNDLVKQYKNEVKKIIKDYLPENNIKPKSRWEEAIKSGRPFIPPSIKNDFESIKIKENEWMLKNLDVDRFRNGDLIPHIKDKKEWWDAGRNSQPAWCYYDNNPENGKLYGKLYNWHAVNDKRGLAPFNWKIPNTWNWTKFDKILDSDNVDFYDVTYNHYGEWVKFECNDEVRPHFYNFYYLLNCYRDEVGNFTDRAGYRFWSSNEKRFLVSDCIRLYQKDIRVEIVEIKLGCGLAVRCCSTNF